jgi:hypothetical protein
MPQYFYISKALPVTFYQLGVPATAGKNFIHLDEDWFSAQIKPWEQEITYYQKWQQTDTITLQVLSEFSTIRLDLIDCAGKVVKTMPFVKKVTSIVGQLWQVYEVSMQMADVDEGLYYLLITVGNNILQFISEPQDIALLHEDTILHTYKNSTNSFEVIYATGVQFTFRAEATITDYAPGNVQAVYEDQTLNLVELSATPFDTFRYKLGASYGVPPWVAKKVNFIFCNDFVLLDEMQYVRADGAKLEPNRADRYPMAGWSMDVRPANNAFSGAYDPSFNDVVAVAYNIKGDTFGATNGLPSTLQITLLERK